MNKSKIFLIFVISLLLVISGAVYATGQTNGTMPDSMSSENQDYTETIIKEYEQKANIQIEAAQAYAALYTTFTVDKDGVVTYPDNYAGAWINGADLYVALTSLDSSAIYDNVFKDFSCIKYVKAEYSLNEMEKVKEKAFEILQKNYSDQIAAFYVDVITNHIVFEVVGNINDIKTTLDSSIETQAFSTKISFDKFVLTKGVFDKPQVNIIGGMEIKHGSAYGPSRSIGICGTIHAGADSFSGIATAGHGSLTLVGANSNIYLNGNPFGVVVGKCYYQNCPGDWALIRMTSSDLLTNTVYGASTSSTRPIVSTDSDLPPGYTILKFGYNGGYCIGTVEAQNVTIFDSVYNISGLTRCTLDSGQSLAGDSGGPYYRLYSSAGNYSFVGVHCSFNESTSKICFTPYVRFSSNFAVKTS